MKIVINTDDDNFVKLYLMVWKTVLRLTDSEITALDPILKRYLSLKNEGVPENHIPTLVFSSTARKEYQADLGWTANQFNNVIKSLKDKNFLELKGEFYSIKDKRIIPTSELTFKFVR